MSEPKLDWSTAKVADAKLEVEVAGELSSEWKQSFETTAQLLRGGEWGAVQLKKQTVIVEDLPSGSEEKLRHHLESIVEQANASGQEEEAPSEESSDGEGQAEQDGADSEMTGVFRSFADGEQSDSDA